MANVIDELAPGIEEMIREQFSRYKKDLQKGNLPLNDFKIIESMLKISADLEARTEKRKQDNSEAFDGMSEAQILEYIKARFQGVK